jgi:alpha-L-fucosidase
MGRGQLVLLIWTVVLAFGAAGNPSGAEIHDLRADDAERGQLFRDGNYAMFIHWGVYSHLGNQVDGKTYYGIGEWIMNENMAGIPIERYGEIAGEFNPESFDAKAIAQLAKDAGMKYIVITSKHHDGFAMFHSKASAFNIVDATPFKRDPMKELAEACKEVGIGLGFYYSHWQDWTAPGGGNGPKTNPDGKLADFDDYFREKCLPQVEEITTGYGPIEIVWFDTPGGIDKKYVEQLVEVVRKNQPDALVSGRAGHGLGDYVTNGDMHVPRANIEGLWETVDTTNDSWAYAWYDENWKTPQEILRRVINTVGRGGTYMLNIGPKGDGTVPERAAQSLRAAGEWIMRYPQVVYGTEASPWQHALPWGDVARKDNTLYLSVFEWPASGELCLPGLKTPVASARLLKGAAVEELTHETAGAWTKFRVPASAPEKLVSVIDVQLESAPEVDPAFGIDPEVETELFVDFAEVSGAKKERVSWMEKFGEWKEIERVHAWDKDGKASWTVDVLKPGAYQADLTYAGEGRIVWGVEIEGGEHIQNQQNSSHNYQRFPIGWLHFPNPGRYTVRVSCLDGDREMASVQSMHLTPIVWE